MTATLHIARRTTPPQLFSCLRERWGAFRLRHFRRQAAFAQLATDHPETVTPSSMRVADYEQMLLAQRDAWFRDIHGPEHRWSPRTFARYTRLMDDVRGCFHPGGAS